MIDNLLTTKQTAAELGLAPLEVLRRIKKGQIKARKLGWNWVITLDEVERVRTEKWYTQYSRRT